jgi:hypothetical protein
LRRLRADASISHVRRQPQDDAWECDEDRNCDQMRDEMRERTVKHFRNRPVGVSGDDKAIEPNRRCDHADLGSHDLDHAEPDRIEAQRLDQRDHDGHRQNQNGKLVHEGSQHDVAAEDQYNDHPTRGWQRGDRGRVQAKFALSGEQPAML